MELGRPDVRDRLQGILEESMTTPDAEINPPGVQS
jgi:hypothetical protein